ncbi:MAG TPA: hypothetical protein VEU62_06975 [Bryobacterales bacterium]|nr:hypothetical protein [Bryobacterales bacterium]
MRLRVAAALASVLLVAAAAVAAEKPFFVYSATFPYQDLPRDLWAERLAQLKAMGFNTVQVPPVLAGKDGGEGDPPLIGVLRLARQLGLRVWMDGGEWPEMERFAASRGGPLLDDRKGRRLTWFPAEEKAAAQKQLLYLADFAAVRRLALRPGKLPAIVPAFDAGWTAGDDVQARPSDPSNYLLAARELLADGVKALNCWAVVEGWGKAEREAALSLAGQARPQAAALRRTGAVMAQFGSMLASMHPSVQEGAVRWAPEDAAGAKPPPLLRLAMLASGEPHGPAFVSALNFSGQRSVSGALEALDPRTGKRALLRGLRLLPRQALLMPMNLTLADREVCVNCSAFAPSERLVWATAELLSTAYENGVLGMEFVAPGEGELELELARRPQGPLITGARVRPFDWDEKTHRVHLHIPAGRPPDFHTRVGLAIDLPETSAFLKAPPRLILGSTAQVTASFSSPELAARSRLLAPAGWRWKADPAPKGASESAVETEITYSLEVPADAVAGDTVTLAVEMEGKIAQTVAATLAPVCDLRIEPEEALHPRRDTRFPIRPRLATLLLPGRRAYHIYLHNNYDEIRTFEVEAAGEGLQISPPKTEVSIGPNLEREVTIYAAPAQPRPGLYPWRLEVREGTRKIETPLALVALRAGETLAYEMDLDRDGAPDLVLENEKLRVVVSPRGGRVVEFLLKGLDVNALAGPGSLDIGPAAVEGRVVDGRLELRSGDTVRRVSLGGRDAFLEVEETGGPGEWNVSTPPDLEASHAKFAIEAPAAKVESEHKLFSTRWRLRFADGATRRAKFLLERIPEPKKEERAAAGYGTSTE